MCILGGFRLQHIRKRIAYRSLLILGVGITLLFFLLVVRLFWIQSVQADWLNAGALAQWQREEFVEPKRGAILDRTGQKLAYTGPSYNVIAMLSSKAPSHVEDPIETARKLAPILEMDAERLIQLMSKKNQYQVELGPGGRKISEEKAEQIRALGLPGIILQKNSKRYYPNHAFAAHILGYVDKEGIAQMGLERQYDDILKGVPGKLSLIKDGKQKVLPTGIEEYQPAQDGKDIVLTIDERIQHFVEQALDEASLSFNAKGIIAIVADPNTMEILAMASRPHFDPNKYTEITNYKNLAINVTYEPGSTFKVITYAAAIEEGLFNPEEIYKAGKYETKSIRPAIKDYYTPKGWGELTFKEGLARSSNVAAVILGYERMKKEMLYDYYHKFGFGQMTGIDYPYETVGKLPDPNVAPPRDIAVTTFGQGLTVTAIEQITAVSAVANGGKLMKPYLVKEIRDPNTGEVVKKNEPTVVRQVISPETSKMMRELMENVVSSKDGTGRGYAIEGYSIAGKTGTAQKVDSTGRYSDDKFIYSFIGFAPADKPELIVYIVVDEPDIAVPSSSAVVGKIFKDVMRNSLQYLQIEPDQKLQSNHETESVSVESLVVPNLEKKYKQVAEQKILQLGLVPNVIGKGETVLRQYPDPGTTVEKGSMVYLLTSQDEIQMPDLTGKSLRDAAEFASLVGLEIEVNGSGFIVEQSIPPGEIIPVHGKLRINLQPLYPSHAGDSYSEEDGKIGSEEPEAGESSESRGSSESETTESYVGSINDEDGGQSGSENDAESDVEENVSQVGSTD
jgi:penicillin-binding protein 2B